VFSNFEVGADKGQWINSTSGPDMQLQENNRVKVNPGGFSPAFSLNLDSLPSFSMVTDGIIRTQLWVKAKTSARAAVVISIEKSGKSLYWKPLDIHHFIFDKEDYNRVTGFLDIAEEWTKEKGLYVKVYLWNNGKEPVTLSGFSVRVEGIIPEVIK
jgi:hypothetical protein